MVGKGGSAPQEDQGMKVLLEEIRSKVQAVAEGHGVLLREIRETRTDFQRGMETGFADLRLGIGTIVSRLDAHERAYTN